MCMEGLIYAFSYLLIRNKTTEEIAVIFKLLPTPNYTHLYWKSQYMVLEELKEFKLPMKIFICRKITCNVVFIKQRCELCNKTLIEPGFCLNYVCNKSKELNIEKILTQEKESVYSLVKIIEELSTTTNDVPEEITCYKCLKCKKCTNTKKCKLHAICKHKITIKRNTNLHYLNKLAIQTTLKHTSNSILL